MATSSSTRRLGERGGVAAGGAGAAAGDAAHRSAYELGRGRSGIQARLAAILTGPARSRHGRTAVTCGSTIGGAQAIPIAFDDLRRNWLRSRRT